MNPTHLLLDTLQSIIQSHDLDPQLRQQLAQIQSSLVGLVGELEQLQLENSELKDRIQRVLQQSSKLDDLAKIIMLWLMKHDSETATAIAFGVNVDKSKTQAVLNELLRMNYVYRLQEDVEKWKLTELGMELSNTLLPQL